MSHLLAFEVRDRRGFHRELLVLKGVDGDLEYLLVGDREDVQLLLRLVLLAGHAVLVGLERGPRVCQGIDDPEVRDLALIGAEHGEARVVLRPRHPDGRGAWTELLVLLAHDACGRALSLIGLAGLLVLQLLLVALSALPVPRIAVVLLAVGRELGLDDGRVIGLLLGQLEVGRIHQEEVVAAREEHRLLVGRDGRPGRVRLLGLELVIEHDRASRQVVLEPPLLLRGRASGPAPCLGLTAAATAAAAAGAATAATLHLVFLLLCLASEFLAGGVLDFRVLRQADAEANLGVVLDELDLVDRQVLRVVRRAQDARELGRHLRVVPQRRLRLPQRLDDPPLHSPCGLVAVPEAIAELEPVRRHRSGEHELRDFR